MTRPLPLLLGALTLASLVSAGTAEAGHAHFSGGVHVGGSVHVGGWGGGVHVGGGAYVGSSYHWSRPAWQPHRYYVGGRVFVGGGYYPYYPRPYYYYPQYVPSYYGESYYPVQPTYAAPGGPSVVAAIAPPPELPRFGVGLFAGGVNTDYNQQTNTQESDVGVLGRYRLTPGLIVEGELGKTSTNVNGFDNVRVDRRLGGSLLYEIGAYNRFAPYVLAGLGVQQAQVGGDYSTTQDFAEIGAGIRFAVTDHFHLTLDVRAGSRSTVSDSGDAMPVNSVARTITPPTSQSNQSEDYTRARLAAILYF